MNNIIKLNNISKYYQTKNGNIHVLNDISFSVEENEFISIVGPSGCGKSTLLNIISGLDKNFNGTVEYNFDRSKIGYMMQDPALFNHLSVLQNSKLACNIKKINNDEYIDKLIDRYGLSEFKNKYPDELSGGMKQRVSLIRTISAKPKLLLLDEPFAALDYQTRLLISNNIYELVKENNISVIMITHDIGEAISISDRVFVLTVRPSKIKNIYNIDLENKSIPSINRTDKYFTKYYEAVGKDLDLFET